MNKGLEQVIEFQRTFMQPVIEKPNIPSKERALFRLSLLKEELEELEKAIKEDDIVEVADAFCDIQYVLNGAIVEFGMQHIFDKMFTDVHNSNMSKACTTFGDLNITQKQYEEQGIQTYCSSNSSNNTLVVVRLEDHKVLKCHNYQEVDLKKYFK